MQSRMLQDDDDQARAKTTRQISMIEVSYERASRINHMSLGFIDAALILAPTALQRSKREQRRKSLYFG